MNMVNPLFPSQINPAMYSPTAEWQQKIERVHQTGSIDSLARPIVGGNNSSGLVNDGTVPIVGSTKKARPMTVEEIEALGRRIHEERAEEAMQYLDTSNSYKKKARPMTVEEIEALGRRIHEERAEEARRYLEWI